MWRLSPRLGDTQGFFVARLRKSMSGANTLIGDSASNVDNAVNNLIGDSASNADNAVNNFTKKYANHSAKSSRGHVAKKHLFQNASSEDGESVWGDYLSKNHVEELGLDVSILDHGNISIFGESVHFVPHKAQLLPKEFSWQGMYMGKVSRAGDVLLSPRCRLMGNLPCVDFEGIQGIETIKGLLCGQSISTDMTAKNVLLRWNGLTLGRLKVKNKRLIWTER